MSILKNFIILEKIVSFLPIQSVYYLSRTNKETKENIKFIYSNQISRNHLFLFNTIYNLKKYPILNILIYDYKDPTSKFIDICDFIEDNTTNGSIFLKYGYNLKDIYVRLQRDSVLAFYKTLPKVEQDKILFKFNCSNLEDVFNNETISDSSTFNPYTASGLPFGYEQFLSNYSNIQVEILWNMIKKVSLLDYYIIISTIYKIIYTNEYFSSDLSKYKIVLGYFQSQCEFKKYFDLLTPIEPLIIS